MNRIIENMGGIATFGVISICLFVVVFVSSLLWAFFQKKPFLKSMATLPLDEAEGDNHHE
jgi:hypothetical protein